MNLHDIRPNPGSGTYPTDLAKKVTIVEVGPRDGLQSLPWTLTVEQRVDLIQELNKCGLQNIEIGSLVSSRKVPRMVDSEAVYRRVQRNPGDNYILLVASNSGLQRAQRCAASSIALLCAASDSFSLKNIGRTIEESLHDIQFITARAKAEGFRVRTYISCAFGCPDEGKIDVDRVGWIAEKVNDFGCDQVCLADTVGNATGNQVGEMLHEISGRIPLEKISVHFHNDCEQGLSNLDIALRCGISCFDTAIAGLGGCPFVRGAAGNIATEDAVLLLDRLGFAHGIDLQALQTLSGRFRGQLKQLAADDKAFYREETP